MIGAGERCGFQAQLGVQLLYVSRYLALCERLISSRLVSLNGETLKLVSDIEGLTTLKPFL